MSKINRIVCAAVKGPMGHVILGVRHFDEYMTYQMNVLPSQEWDEGVEGFIDKNGTFQNRKHALDIAVKAGQLNYYTDNVPLIELFSEHLY
jgi:hypothetical protein